MDADLAALARCVGDVDVFAELYWGRRALLRRNAGRFGDLIDLDAVETLLVTTARRPTFRLVRDGAPLSPGRYTTTVRLGGATIDDAADVGRIAELVSDGATLVLQGLQRTWLPLVRFCRSLERATSHPVQANAYLTPAGAAGLRAHGDAHEVVVLQVAGTKTWTVDGLGELELVTGDALYLPAGTTHAAAAQSETSLHLTIGILRDTYRHVIGRMLDDADLDRPLPLGFARPEHAGALAAGLAHVLSATSSHLARADAAEVAATEVGRAARRRRPVWTGQLRSVLAMTDIGDGTRLVRRPDNPATIGAAVDADGRLVLGLVDRELSLPAHARGALEVVLGRREMVVGDLVGLDLPGRCVLARRLVLEGLLEVG